MENMFEDAQMRGGDEQLPDNIQNIVDGAHSRALQRHPSRNELSSLRRSKIKKRKALGIRVGSKVKVFCAIGSYMGRKRTNFVKDGVVQCQQPGKYAHDEKARRKRRDKGQAARRESATQLTWTKSSRAAMARPTPSTTRWCTKTAKLSATSELIVISLKIGCIQAGSKVEVFCAIGSYMGRKRTNFVKDGVVQCRQPGKYVHDGKARRKRRDKGSSGEEGKRNTIDMDEIVPAAMVWPTQSTTRWRMQTTKLSATSRQIVSI